jgi:hypothetical protein
MGTGVGKCCRPGGILNLPLIHSCLLCESFVCIPPGLFVPLSSFAPVYAYTTYMFVCMCTHIYTNTYTLHRSIGKFLAAIRSLSLWTCLAIVYLFVGSGLRKEAGANFQILY